jgi:hypothetical protein
MAGMMAASSRDKWSTVKFYDRLAFVCEKSAGGEKLKKLKSFKIFLI